MKTIERLKGHPSFEVAEAGEMKCVGHDGDYWLVTAGGLAGRWSNKNVCKVGDKVLVTMNGLGEGECVGFFVEAGFVGLFIKPVNPPEWWVKQNADKGRDCYTVFGAEVKIDGTREFVELEPDPATLIAALARVR